MPSIKVLTAGWAAVDAPAETSDRPATCQTFDGAEKSRAVEQQLGCQIRCAVNWPQLDTGFSIDYAVFSFSQFAFDQIKQSGISEVREQQPMLAFELLPKLGDFCDRIGNDRSALSDLNERIPSRRFRNSIPLGHHVEFIGRHAAADVMLSRTDNPVSVVMNNNPAPYDHIVFTEFDGAEGILVDLDTKKYYQLNETAMLIWKGLEQGRSSQDIADELVTNYEVTPEDALQNVEVVLKKFEAYKLVARE